MYCQYIEHISAYKSDWIIFVPNMDFLRAKSCHFVGHVPS